MHREDLGTCRYPLPATHELYSVGSWSDHFCQRQGRITVDDRASEELALACTDGTPVEVSHLFFNTLISICSRSD
jgi:hypothetical protein